MTDTTSVRVQQWLFVEATSATAAKALVKREFIDTIGCSWADTVHLDSTRPVVSGADAKAFARVVSEVKATQKTHLGRLWTAVRDVDWDEQVAGHDPYRGAPQGGVLAGILGLVAGVLGGEWGPYSAGWDTVSETADLTGVRARMKANPLRQFAVSVTLTY